MDVHKNVYQLPWIGEKERDRKEDSDTNDWSNKSVLCLQNHKLFSVYFLQDVDLLKNNTLENRVTSQCF